MLLGTPPRGIAPSLYDRQVAEPSSLPIAMSQLTQDLQTDCDPIRMNGKKALNRQQSSKIRNRGEREVTSVLAKHSLSRLLLTLIQAFASEVSRPNYVTQTGAAIVGNVTYL